MKTKFLFTLILATALQESWQFATLAVAARPRWPLDPKAERALNNKA